jgi:hypothetical protein
MQGAVRVLFVDEGIGGHVTMHQALQRHIGENGSTPASWTHRRPGCFAAERPFRCPCSNTAMSCTVATVGARGRRGRVDVEAVRDVDPAHRAHAVQRPGAAVRDRAMFPWTMSKWRAAAERRLITNVVHGADEVLEARRSPLSASRPGAGDGG